ncbi:hypothetical protein SAY86_031551 [Trapa natans]|uniref:Uncharacterized protein n=1 Tax=Trapa natans TaxID=22666 RepID=A0AAN7M3R3_TRANT|nr:hypothetical protein SAY86_031551 [Trapa natans]
MKMQPSRELLSWNLKLRWIVTKLRITSPVRSFLRSPSGSSGPKASLSSSDRPPLLSSPYSTPPLQDLSPPSATGSSSESWSSDPAPASWVSPSLRPSAPMSLSPTFPTSCRTYLSTRRPTPPSSRRPEVLFECRLSGGGGGGRGTDRKRLRSSISV